MNFGPQTKKFYWRTLSHPGIVFGWTYISALRRCCPLKFSYALEIDQAFTAHTQMEMGSPKNVWSWKLKIWLKIQRNSPYNFDASGNILTKLLQATWWTSVHILTHAKCLYTVSWRIIFRCAGRPVRSAVGWWALRTTLPLYLLRRPITYRCTVLRYFGVIRQLPLLIREEFRLPKLILHSDLRRRAASRRALPSTSSFSFLFSFLPHACRSPRSTDFYDQHINMPVFPQRSAFWGLDDAK